MWAASTDDLLDPPGLPRQGDQRACPGAQTDFPPSASRVIPDATLRAATSISPRLFVARIPAAPNQGSLLLRPDADRDAPVPAVDRDGERGAGMAYSVGGELAGDHPCIVDESREQIAQQMRDHEVAGQLDVLGRRRPRRLARPSNSHAHLVQSSRTMRPSRGVLTKRCSVDVHASPAPAGAEANGGLSLRRMSTALVALAAPSAADDRWSARMTGNGQTPGSGRNRTRISMVCSACVRGTGVDGGGVSRVLEPRHAGARCMRATTSPAGSTTCSSPWARGRARDAASTRLPVLVPIWPNRRRPERSLAGLPRRGRRHRRPCRLRLPDPRRRHRPRHAGPLPTEPGALDPGQVALGLTAVDEVGISLLTPDSTDGQTYPLTVHRAAGMVMVQLAAASRKH